MTEIRRKGVVICFSAEGTLLRERLRGGTRTSDLRCRVCKNGYRLAPLHCREVRIRPRSHRYRLAIRAGCMGQIVHRKSSGRSCTAIQVTEAHNTSTANTASHLAATSTSTMNAIDMAPSPERNITLVYIDSLPRASYVSSLNTMPS